MPILDTRRQIVLVAMAERQIGGRAQYALRISHTLISKGVVYPAIEWLTWPQPVIQRFLSFPGARTAYRRRELQVPAGGVYLDDVLHTLQQALYDYTGQISRRPDGTSRPSDVMVRGFDAERDEWRSQGKAIHFDIQVTPAQTWALYAFARELGRMVLNGQSLDHFACWETHRGHYVFREIWSSGQEVGRWGKAYNNAVLIAVFLRGRHPAQHFYVDPDGTCWRQNPPVRTPHDQPRSKAEVYTTIRRALEAASSSDGPPGQSEPSDLLRPSPFSLTDYVEGYLSRRNVRASI
jgi:hypothetical protein